jgi:hypothetical protein
MDTDRFNVKNITREQLSDQKTRERFHEKYNKFTQIRSIVIDDSLEIENLLTIVLLHFLVHKDYRRHRLLRTLIFEAEFCTFMHQRRMLSLIFDIFPNSLSCFTEEEGKQLRRNINDLILDRDMFAHGHIFIDAQTEDVVIRYYRGGRKERVIADNFLDGFKKMVRDIDEKLSLLNENFRENEFVEDVD